MSDEVFQAHLRPAICTFCGKAAPYAPLELMESNGVQVFFCKTCMAEYLYWPNQKLPFSTSLYVKINDRMYRWSVFSSSGVKKAQLWHIKKPGEPGTRVNRDLELIKYFTNSIPDITPSNIDQKIRVWLTFL